MSWVITDPTTNKGTWTLEEDGSVWAYDAPYCGSLIDEGIKLLGPISGFAPFLFPSGWGYIVVVNAGTPVESPALPGQAAGDIHRYYEFPRK